MGAVGSISNAHRLCGTSATPWPRRASSSRMRPNAGYRRDGPVPIAAGVRLSWLKRGRHWIAYDPNIPIIAGLFFETDDIPNGLR